ncbi:MAG: transposase [Bacteroidia bacterium]
MKTKERKNYSLRQQRIFSLEIRRQTVRDIESGKCSVGQAADELQVSQQAIYGWIHKFSRYLKKNRRMVVEDNSEAYKSRELEKKIKELEAIIGRKQMEIDLLNRIIDFGNTEYKTDLKKNLSKNRSNGSDSSKG